MRMKLFRSPLLRAVVAASFIVAGAWSPVRAQISDAHQRAVNLARMRAEHVNGGLGRYRAATCMYDTSAGGGSCLINTEGGFTFRFEGGPPGWQQNGLEPTVESEITISIDGRTVVKETYNATTP